MKYQRELELRLREIKAKIDAAELDIREKMKRGEDFTDETSRVNNLSVDLMTVRSRIENFGKDVYISGHYRTDK